MAVINISSIMDKVNEYVESGSGKDRIDKRLDYFRKNGVSITYGKGRLTTFREMHAAASEMERTAKETAAAYKLPNSVQEHFDTLHHEPPVKEGEGKYRVDLYFRSDLRRPSLLINAGPQKGQRTGGGIDNIVSLFDTGYVAHSQVFGIWDGHEDRGLTASLMYRPGMGFMREAVSDFNRRFGRRYGVTASLSDDVEDAGYYMR